MPQITVSCGIGRSFEEAVYAVKGAKRHKGKGLRFNTEIYRGKRLRSKIPEGFKKRVVNYFRLKKILNKKQQKLLEDFSLRDPITGMLNKTGFVMRLEELKRKKGLSGYYILFDLDDLHYWNKRLGYSKVDKQIKRIGKIIFNSIRHNHAKGRDDIVGHRLNESAGDEFLIFVPFKHSKKNLQHTVNIANRIISKINV